MVDCDYYRNEALGSFKAENSRPEEQITSFQEEAPWSQLWDSE